MAFAKWNYERLSVLRIWKSVFARALSFMYLWLIFPNVMRTLKNLTDVYVLKNSQHYNFLYIQHNRIVCSLRSLSVSRFRFNLARCDGCCVVQIVCCIHFVSFYCCCRWYNIIIIFFISFMIVPFQSIGVRCIWSMMCERESVCYSTLYNIISCVRITYTRLDIALRVFATLWWIFDIFMCLIFAITATNAQCMLLLLGFVAIFLTNTIAGAMWAEHNILIREKSKRKTKEPIQCSNTNASIHLVASATLTLTQSAPSHDRV